MKFLPLLLANLKRRKIRTVLTILSFSVALFLFGFLAAVKSGFNQAIDVAGADRLFVINKASFVQPLPLPYLERLRRVEGVKLVTHVSWFGGVYQDEKNFFAQFAIEPASWLEIYPEFTVPDDQWKAFLADRAGCVVGAATAARFGWKVGDRVPIRGAGFPGDWAFNVRGIYRGTRPADDETQFWFHAAHLYEKAPDWWKGFVGWYVVQLANPDEAAGVSKRIDGAFSNSAWETLTQPEKAFAASFVKQMGNIQFLILAVGSVVFFTLLLVTGNTMAISVRERTGELAVLKAVGFSDQFVLGLVLAESLLIALVGGALGLAAVKYLTVSTDLAPGLLLLYIPAAALGAGVLAALAVGLLAGLIPALSAMRLSVVEALRRI